MNRPSIILFATVLAISCFIFAGPGKTINKPQFIPDDLLDITMVDRLLLAPIGILD